MEKNPKATSKSFYEKGAFKSVNTFVPNTQKKN